MNHTSGCGVHNQASCDCGAERVPIEKMLVLSTGHVSKETAELLDRTVEWDRAATDAPFPKELFQSCIYGKGEYGWIVYVWDDEPDPCPDDLKACVEFARSSGCQWVMFDCDSATIEELPTFDW